MKNEGCPKRFAMFSTLIQNQQEMAAVSYAFNLYCPAWLWIDKELHVSLGMHRASSEWRGMVMCVCVCVTTDFYWISVVEKESVTNIHNSLQNVCCALAVDKHIVTCSSVIALSEKGQAEFSDQHHSGHPTAANTQNVASMHS